MEARELPNLRRYIERLPEGLDSYPSVTVKASVYRDTIEALPLDDTLELLPDELRELVAHPLPVTAWIPEVRSLSILVAVRDRYFPQTEAGLDEYAEWVYQRNRKLLSRPLYRALFLLVSPERLMSGVERRWSAFRRGTSLRLLTKGPGMAELVIGHEPHLYDEVIRRGMCGAFRAAAAAAGARDTKAWILDSTERQTQIRVEWK